MSRPIRSRVQTLLGMLVASLGVLIVSVGLARAAFIPDVFGVEGWIVATTEGFALLFAGIAATLVALAREEDPAPLRTATEAFHARMQSDFEMLNAAPPRPIGAPPPMRAAGLGAPIMTPSMQRLDPALFRLDEEIRDITRRINKAGVKLATGQLSDEGYAQYVEELKRQRGQLEAQRVRIELRSK